MHLLWGKDHLLGKHLRSWKVKERKHLQRRVFEERKVEHMASVAMAEVIEVCISHIFAMNL